MAVENLKIHLTLALLIFKFILLAIHSEPKKRLVIIHISTFMPAFLRDIYIDCFDFVCKSHLDLYT